MERLVDAFSSDRYYLSVILDRIKFNGYKYSFSGKEIKNAIIYPTEEEVVKEILIVEDEKNNDMMIFQYNPDADKRSIAIIFELIIHKNI